MQTRRDILRGSAAVVAASTLPAVSIGAVAFAEAIPAPTPPAPPMLAWSFDIRHGDYRSTVIAPDAETAHALMIDEHFDCDLADDCPRRVYGNKDECTAEDCNCSDSGMDEVRREPLLDAAAARGDITIEDYEDAGWGYVCDRCGGEPMGGDWHSVEHVAVCNDCITIEEWKVINPKHAAELEEDALIDGMTDEEFDAYETAKKATEAA